MNRRYFYFAILVLIIAGLLYLFLLQNDRIDDRIEIQSSELVQSPEDFPVIETSIKNISQDTIPQMLIGYELYDQSGKKIATGSFVVDRMLPGQTRELEHKLIDFNGVSDYKITSVSEKKQQP